jgi:hypothetical protein
MQPSFNEVRSEKLTVRIPESLRRGLEDKAASEFTTLASLVNRAVYLYLTSGQEEAPQGDTCGA